MTDKERAVAIGGYSPVSYFEHGPGLGKSDFAATHEGITYYLASEEQRAKFKAHPEKYVPAFGGLCAFGQSIEKDFVVDPTSYKIVDGRLLLFLKNSDLDALKLWNQGNERELLEKADRHFGKRAD